VVVQGAIYAVLVAGSPGSGSGCGPNMFAVFSIARLYNRLIRNGVPADNIIVFMNAGRINDTSCNPQPGYLIGMDGIDYAAGLKVDYDYQEMNTDNLFAVYQGNASAIRGGSGRVLKSGSDDTVLLAHESHGVHGWLQLGDNGIKHKVLNQQLETMKQNGKFKGALFMVSACYSGAVFDDSLVSKTGVYAITSSGPDTVSGFGWCRTGNGTKACTSSTFSYGWIHHLDTVRLDNESLLQEYQSIHENGLEHRIRQYGSMETSSLLANWFQGINNVSQSAANLKHIPSGEVFPQSPIAPYLAYKHELKINPKMANDKKFMRELNNMEEERVHIRKMVKEVVTMITRNKFNNIELESFISKAPERIVESDCHENALDLAFKKCPNVFKTPFIDDLMVPITNLCNAKYSQNEILEAINKLCSF